MNYFTKAEADKIKTILTEFIGKEMFYAFDKDSQK